MNKAPDISICICTFKRQGGLAHLLQTLENVEVLPSLSIEIVVVDNDAAGSAAAVIDVARKTLLLQLRYFVEPKAGVGNARNRCVSEARGDWIAFVDDDELVSPQWLTALWKQAAHSQADAVFGPVVALVPQPAPAWHRSSGFFDRHHAPSGSRMIWQHCASGNVLIRRELLQRLGGFDEEFSMSGAEDTDMFRRCFDAGAHLVWCEEALVEETVSPARMEKRWARLRAYLGGQNYARLVRRHDGVPAFFGVVLKGLAGVLAYALPALLLVPFNQSAALRYQCRLAASFGKAVGWFASVQHYGGGATTAKHA